MPDERRGSPNLKQLIKSYLPLFLSTVLCYTHINYNFKEVKTVWTLC